MRTARQRYSKTPNVRMRRNDTGDTYSYTCVRASRTTWADRKQRKRRKTQRVSHRSQVDKVLEMKKYEKGGGGHVSSVTMFPPTNLKALRQNKTSDLKSAGSLLRVSILLCVVGTYIICIYIYQVCRYTYPPLRPSASIHRVEYSKFSLFFPLPKN